ncbi:MAG: hypothetical protein H5T78_08745 [Nocardia sp.]|nr:hypothetical protein [Nocardia sp.]
MPIEEYDANYRTALELLTTHARQVVVISEPPIGWDPSIDVPAANLDLIEYNRRARRAADDAGALFIDLWEAAIRTATALGWSPSAPSAPATGALSVWSDGVHLSEIGDELLRQVIADQISTHQIIDNLLTLDRLDRAAAYRRCRGRAHLAPEPPTRTRQPDHRA